MKETKHVIIAPEQNFQTVKDEQAKDGWKFKSQKMAIVVFFEREIPDPPTEKSLAPLSDELIDAMAVLTLLSEDATSQEDSPSERCTHTPPEDDPDPARDFDPTAGLR